MAVEFNEENNFNQEYRTENATSVSGLTKWIIKKGIAKDKKGAERLMIIVAIVCFAIAIYFTIK
jgi:hypothetical protein